MELVRPRDAYEFEGQAGAFLRAREAENNLALGIISSLTRADPRRYTVTPYFSVARRGHQVVGAVMRLGLWLIVTDGTDPDALPLLIDTAVREQPDAPGIVGPKELARYAVQLWQARTGVRARLNMAERIYLLERVIPPRLVHGAPRVATPADRATVVEWFHDFVARSLPGQDASREAAERSADGWIGGQALWVWEDGDIVSMAGASGRTPNGIRVSAVYTPPERRRRGYASALVAALSQAQLDDGLRYCFLYTDLANPTSNRIYQDVGYVPVCDVDQYSFITG